jgi:hypothetical protein
MHQKERHYELHSVHEEVVAYKPGDQGGKRVEDATSMAWVETCREVAEVEKNTN